MRIELKYAGIALVVVAVIAVVVALPLLGAGTQSGEEKVVAMMPFYVYSEWLGFYTAELNGYYAEEGLDVEFQYTDSGGFGPVKHVVAGTVDFSYIGSDSLLIARDQGNPIVAVYQAEHGDQFGLIYDKSKTSTPADLIGKKIAVPGPNSPPEISAKAILMENGISPDEVEFVYLGNGVIPAMLTEEVDAVAGIIIHELILEAEGVDIGVWYASDYGMGLGTTSVITSEKTLSERPELVRKFLRATKKGWAYAMDNPEEMTNRYIAELNPDGEGFKEIELGYWVRLTDEVYKPDEFGLGEFIPKRWQNTSDILLKLELIEKQADLDGAYTTEFLPN